jgi:hypothetical protein
MPLRDVEGGMLSDQDVMACRDRFSRPSRGLGAAA